MQVEDALAGGNDGREGSTTLTVGSQLAMKLSFQFILHLARLRRVHQAGDASGGDCHALADGFDLARSLDLTQAAHQRVTVADGNVRMTSRNSRGELALRVESTLWQQGVKAQP